MLSVNSRRWESDLLLAVELSQRIDNALLFVVGNLGEYRKSQHLFGGEFGVGQVPFAIAEIAETILHV